MSGHNKFSKIKRLKAKTDAQKSAVFTKMAKMLQVEAKKAGGNVSSSGLKAAIERAKAADMPNDNIERAIKKAMGAEAEQMEAITYEAYGPAGVGIIIDVLTSNRNKAAAEVKHILSNNSSSLATPGSASWAFEKTTEGWIPKTTMPISEEDTPKLEKLIDELEDNEEVQEVYTNAE
ncbi:MAG: YebC/PmpR family DNA-binding transcriptional regulator [Candidatus Paceibacterota bacterium]|nr:YebC/PmpR family DNA-binding transcriptional regulator [Candidatus Paceibacterota bacterium]